MRQQSTFSLRNLILMSDEIDFKYLLNPHALHTIRFKRNFADKKIISLFFSLPLLLSLSTLLSLVIKTPRRDLSQHARVTRKTSVKWLPMEPLVKASRITDELRICQHRGKDAYIAPRGFIRQMAVITFSPDLLCYSLIMSRNECIHKYDVHIVAIAFTVRLIMNNET